MSGMRSLLLIGLILLGLQQQIRCQEVSVVPTRLDSPIDEVVWCGSDRVRIDDEETIVLDDIESKIYDIIFLLTDDGIVYVTNSHGAKWANFSQILQKENDGQQIKIRELLASADDSKTIFLIGDNGTSFVTKNCGKNFSIFKHDARLQNIQINRMNDSYILGTVPKKCSSQDEECDEDEKSLVVSTNQGKNWKTILENVQEASWDKLIHYEVVPDFRIMATHRIYQTGPDNDLKYLSYSDDFFKTKQVIVKNPIQFYQSIYYLFVLTPAANSWEGYTLKISPSFSESYTPQEIDLPIKRIKDHSFTVLDTYGSQIYLAINHENEASKMTNIYQSDMRGQQFQLTLMQTVRNLDGNVDFERILGTQGTFIANVYDSHEFQRLKDRGSVPKETSQGKQKILASLDQYKKTKISFNSGGAWHFLTAPEFNHEGNPISCSGECSLHLKGRTEKNGNPIYTTEKSPGLIIATGNTGIYLEEKDKSINTYLSRDGGHTWFEIKKHSHMYEIGDHGGLILLARDDTLTTHIEYSWNQGISWEKLQVSQKPIEIETIVTEPSNMRQKFLIYAKRKSDSSNKMIGVIIALDFSKLQPRVCMGQLEPGTEDSDYEFWSPTNYEGKTCIFGISTSFVRRKRDKRCYNSDEYDSVVDMNSCECTREDWECEFGYQLDEQTDECKPISDRFDRKKKEMLKPPADCKGFVLIPSGYKKIPDSYCEGGVDLGPKKIDCPPSREKAKKNETEYVPLEEEQAPDLDELYKNLNKSSEQSTSFSDIFKISLFVLLALAIFKYKNSILSLFSSKPSGSGYSRVSHNSNKFEYKQSVPENQRLFFNNDDEEEQI